MFSPITRAPKAGAAAISADHSVLRYRVVTGKFVARGWWVRWAIAAALVAAGCSSDGDDEARGGAGSGQASESSNGSGGSTNSDFSNSAGDGDGADIVATGGQGGQVTDDGLDCDTQLLVTVRDFTEAHPDFESGNGRLDGIVEVDLGMDNTPVYAPPGPTSVTAGAAEFAQWYHDTPGVNVRVPGVGIAFDETTPGVFIFDSDAFFPIDGMGLGNGPSTQIIPGVSLGDDHNYLFTTEVHTRFTYKGGELFSFRGDDDLWIFINRKLAIDLGGVHGPEEKTLDIDADAAVLGLTVGETYAMDIFHAERHTTGSNFRIETTIDFSCIVNIPPLE